MIARALRDPRLTPALIAVVAIAALSFVVSDRARDEVDVDQAVYAQTLDVMHEGEGYYRAMRDALTVKEGAPPSQVRAIRPPTTFLLLRLFPSSWARGLAAVACLLSLVAAAMLGLPFGRFGPLAAVAGVGVWVIGAMPHLFLHAELWGLPFFLWGLLCVRERSEVGAAALLCAAVAFRELYAVGFVVAALASRRRAPWLVAAGSLAVLVAVHVALAHTVLSSGGHQVALGNEGLSARLMLSTISPGDKPVAWALGVGGTVLGAIGVARSWRWDRAVLVVAAMAIVVGAGALVATRSYWSLTYGPALFAFAPGAFARVGDRSPSLA